MTLGQKKDMRADRPIDIFSNAPTHHKYKSVHVQETIKCMDIRDAFNQLKYRICLTSYDISDDAVGMLYEIVVTNYFTSPDKEPLVIMTVPEEGSSETITDYDEAVGIYNDLVKKYAALVKAETRDMQDIDIFKEKIGYEITCPKCCATCKYCNVYVDKDRKIEDRSLPWRPKKRPFERTILECTNPKNTKEYNFDLDQMEGRKSPKPYPFYRKKPEPSILVLAPRVELFGTCKNYEKKQTKNAATT